MAIKVDNNNSSVSLKPLVSIIMSTYNNAAFIAQAIESVLAQDFLDWEFLIINDASADATDSIIKAYLNDKRIKYYSNQQNIGLIGNLNKGLEIALGKYIARLDSDDYWIDPQKLSIQVGFLEQNPGYALVGSGVKVIDADDHFLFQRNIRTQDSEIRKEILVRNPFVHSSVVFNRDAIIALGGYNVRDLNTEDYGLWLRVGAYFQFANIAEPLSAYRLNRDGLIRSNFLKSISMSLALIRQHRKVYPNYMYASLRWNMRYWSGKILGAGGFHKVLTAIKNAGRMGVQTGK